MDGREAAFEKIKAGLARITKEIKSTISGVKCKHYFTAG
jgi:hypothetical protein